MGRDVSIYEGAATHYRYGRPSYSPQLKTVLTEELNLDGKGRLLDVGCGPGSLTVRLAHLFPDAVGIDPDSGMLAEGRRAAQERKIDNITWVQAQAEDLPGPAPGPYRVVTFGQSFHWTDEARVAEAVYDMLSPGGALALIRHKVEGPRTAESRTTTDPTRRHYGTGAYLPRSDEAHAPGSRARPSARRRGRPRSYPVRFTSGGLPPGIPDLVRDVESVLSGYFSMSSSTPHMFGDRVEAFAGEVRELLRAQSPEGLFWDWPGDTVNRSPTAQGWSAACARRRRAAGRDRAKRRRYLPRPQSPRPVVAAEGFAATLVRHPRGIPGGGPQARRRRVLRT